MDMCLQQKIEQLFNVEYGQMKQILENAIHLPVSKFSYKTNKLKQGFSGIVGNYLIPTFSIYAQDGRIFEKDIFIRREPDGQRGFTQAHHYQYLKAQQIPVPDLYGWFFDEENREVLFLEYLTEIKESESDFLRDSENCHLFVQLMAKFAANQPTMSYLSLVGRDMAYRGDYTREWKTWMLWSIFMLDTVWEHAVNGRLNNGLKEMCQNGQGTKLRLQSVAKYMITYIHTFDLGIIHGDFKTGNTAWRTYKKELAVLDLEDMMLDVKFYDAAMYFGAPKSRSMIDYDIMDDLIEYFLGEYSQYTGQKIAFDTFKREMQILWFTRKLNLWEWLPHDLHGPSYRDPEKGKDHSERCQKLYELLQSMFLQLPMIEQLLSL